MDLREPEPSTEKKDKAGGLPPIRLQDIGIPKLLLVIVAGVALLVLSVPSGWIGGSAGKTQQSSNHTGTSSASDTTVSAMEIYTDKKEKQLEEILAKVQGIGKVEVMITLDSAQEKNRLQENTKVQKVEGVLVVAEGAGNAQVNAEIIQAVQALFSLESHKIRVMKME